jgi:quinoprotein glucose dehydrogenase
VSLKFWTVLFALPLAAQQWPVYGGDDGGSNYSPLNLIQPSNVSKLRLVWEWKSGEQPMPQFGSKPGPFEGTPVMIDGILYFPSSYYRVIALDAQSGHELWSYDPKAYQDGADPNTRYSHRGVAAWRDGGKLRIFLNFHQKLVCLEAATGRPVAGFGDNGVINLVQDLRWPVNSKHYSNSSPPVIYKDLVIVGSNVNDYMVYKKDPPGDLRAFNARTGKLAWTFHTVPESNEPGAETWGAGSEKFTGHTNVWAPFTVDSTRGLVYLPVSTASNDFYGGGRPGQNLFAESIVCLDANTGKLKWYRQLVHHGLWDYDLASAPTLVTITVAGKNIDAVVQLTKMGFVFVFDRESGKPVWPIEERPVPASDVPGEKAWPTQPFPLKPAPISDQGVTLDDAFDLTPELKAEAMEEMKKYRLGPLFTPPSLRGTLMKPGVIGGANWGGGAFDPETGLIYVKTSNNGSLARVMQPKRNPDQDADYVMEPGSPAVFHDRLPLLRPPYGHLTAIDLNKGEIAWREVFGDTASVRKHPALKGVRLPEKLGVAGAQGVIVTKGGLVFAGSGDEAFHAIDKATGRDLWTFPLPRRVTATPMTYRGQDGRQYVVVATGIGSDAELMAFAL